MLRTLKKGNVSEEEYVRKKGVYKQFSKKKKEKRGDEELRRLKNIKEGKEFWEEINKRRRKRENISKKIKAEKWDKHFGDTWEAKSEKFPTNWEMEQEEEDIEEITESELDEVIKKLKKGKSPGQDGIPNEAWREADEGTKDMLRKILTKILKGGNFPEEWRTGVIVPVFKKGDKDEAKTTEE